MVNAVFAWIVGVALAVVVPTIVVLVVQERVRRQKRHALNRAVDEATAICSDVARLRAQAVADGAEAAFVSPGHRDVDVFLAGIFRRSDR